MKTKPNQQLEDTGERLIPELHPRSITYGEHLARYRAAVGLVKGKTVLDIACGTGYGTRLLAAQAKQVIGMDVSEEAVAYAQEHYPKPNITYQSGDALRMPLKDNAVDVIVSLETIEHLPTPEVFVKEVKRVLKPGGLFVVSTPNDDEFTEGNIYHVHEFDFKELDGLMKKHFKNHTYYFQGSWYASGILSKKTFEETFESDNFSTTKSFTQGYDKAIYYIAIASDAALEPLEENVVVADVFSAKAAQENHFAVTSELDSLHKETKKLQGEVAQLAAQKVNLESTLNAIYNSKSWKLMGPARVAMRKVIQLRK